MKEMAATIRAYIVALRKERGLTIDEMADKIDMSRRTYIEWEQGRTNDLKSVYLLRAMRVLGGSLEDLERAYQLSPSAIADHARQAAAMTDEQLRETIDLLERLRPRPDLLSRWLGYGSGIAAAPPPPDKS